jgi:hypothetical protein
MSMADYTNAKSIINTNPSRSRFVGSRPESLVEKAEQALGVRFSQTYRAFLLEFGAGSFGSAEFFGVIDEDWNESSIPDGVWYTLNERAENNLPSNLVVIGDTGTGEFFVLDLIHPEGPVFVVDPSDPIGTREAVAPDFGTFLLERVREVVP